MVVAANEMPKYVCHKEVWALKIESIEFRIDGSGILYFDSAHFGPRTMPKEYMEKHSPHSGGYYVQYKGGYESFSPADAFEGGYTLIT